MDFIPIPAPVSIRTQECMSCLKTREVLVLEFTYELEGTLRRYEVFYCWTCYRRLVKSITDVNGLHCAQQIAQGQQEARLESFTDRWAGHFGIPKKSATTTA